MSRALVAAALIAMCAMAYFAAKWNFANAIAWRLDPSAPEAELLSDWLVEMSPNDPNTQYFLALYLEKSFDPGSEASAIAAFRRTVELSPYNFIYRLSLAKALSGAGETDAAAAEFERALDLAPHNANVQWAYGNFLIRQGRTEDGFRMLSSALAGNERYAIPAISLAMQIFQGDLVKLRAALGEHPDAEMALALYLVNDKRFDDAIAIWQKVTERDKSPKAAMFSELMAERLVGMKRYSLAAAVMKAISGVTEAESGKVRDGGFESGVKMRDAGTFDWTIGKGDAPQITLTESGVRSGRYGLLLVFNSFATADFREVSQIVLAEAGANYEMEAWYRSDLKTEARYQWEVVDAATGALLARTPALVPTSEWTAVKAPFKMPPGSDAAIIRFTRDGCIGPTCPTAGRIVFDDISLRQL